MPATIQQDITLCINATGCHFTGPLVLRHSLSTVLPILYLWNYTVVDTLVLFTDTLYIIYYINIISINRFIMTRSELRSPLYSPWRMDTISINHIKLINTIIIIIISINIINTNMIKPNSSSSSTGSMTCIFIII